MTSDEAGVAVELATPRGNLDLFHFLEGEAPLLVTTVLDFICRMVWEIEWVSLTTKLQGNGCNRTIHCSAAPTLLERSSGFVSIHRGKHTQHSDAFDVSSRQSYLTLRRVGEIRKKF